MPCMTAASLIASASVRKLSGSNVIDVFPFTSPYS